MMGGYEGAVRVFRSVSTQGYRAWRTVLLFSLFIGALIENINDNGQKDLIVNEWMNGTVGKARGRLRAEVFIAAASMTEYMAD